MKKDFSNIFDFTDGDFNIIKPIIFNRDISLHRQLASAKFESIDQRLSFSYKQVDEILQHDHFVCCRLSPGETRTIVECFPLLTSFNQIPFMYKDHKTDSHYLHHNFLIIIPQTLRMWYNFLEPQSKAEAQTQILGRVFDALLWFYKNNVYDLSEPNRDLAVSYITRKAILKNLCSCIDDIAECGYISQMNYISIFNRLCQISKKSQGS